MTAFQEQTPLQRAQEGKPERDREHALDRMVIAATWRARRARDGHGFVFRIPEKARR